MSARFNSRFAKLTIIQVYVPTNDAEDVSKEEFHEQLQREVEETARHDVLIVMGDLNAKIGQDNEGWEKVMGQHGLGRMNENGESLATFCGNNDLVIGGSLFKHRDIRKITWKGSESNRPYHHQWKVQRFTDGLPSNERGRRQLGPPHGYGKD